MNYFGGVFGVSNQVDIDIQLEGDELKKTNVLVPAFSSVDGKPATQEKEMNLFAGDDVIKGKVVVKPTRDTNLEHSGIKLQLLGQIEKKGKTNHYIFLSFIRELDAPGIMCKETEYDFDFGNIEKNYESFYGRGCRLRYILRVKIVKRYGKDIVHEDDFAVQIVGAELPYNNERKLVMSLGLNDSLAMDFEYNKSAYHFQDCVLGKIFFKKVVDTDVPYMTLEIVREETCGAGVNLTTTREIICSYEVMDGQPGTGDCIPIRCFLSPFRFSATMKNIHNKFSVTYYLGLTYRDLDDRRYYKQQEIRVWRKDLETLDDKPSKSYVQFEH
eukprot:92540_1